MRFYIFSYFSTVLYWSAKFHYYRPNGCSDIKIFHLLRWRPSVSLGFKKYGDTCFGPETPEIMTFEYAILGSSPKIRTSHQLSQNIPNRSSRKFQEWYRHVGAEDQSAIRFAVAQETLLGYAKQLILATLLYPTFSLRTFHYKLTSGSVMVTGCNTICKSTYKFLLAFDSVPALLGAMFLRYNKID